MTDAQTIQSKYHDIIAEEVNVKEVSLLPATMNITKTFVPIGKELSSAFGKDTGKIIGAAKQGNAKELGNSQLEVFQGDEKRILEANQYEVRYSGIDETHQIVEDGVVVSLNLELTDDLKKEGVAREISRFLNQMRKEADYKVDSKVSCYYNQGGDILVSAITSHADFLKKEALLNEIISSKESGDVTKTLDLSEGSITFTLKQ